MAALAAVRGRHVAALLADRLLAVVTAVTPGRDARMVEARTEPGGRQVTVAALEARGDMSWRLAHRLCAVVTDDAEAGNGQRNLRVIDARGRIPAHHRVTGRAVLAGRWMSRTLTLGGLAVVTAHAGAEHFPVVEEDVGPEGDGVVAGLAFVGRLNVRRRLRRRVVGRAGDVARAAASRRALEHRIDMA